MSTKTKSVSYTININNKRNMNESLHIKVNSLSNKNQVIALSTDDQKCLNNRKLLGMQSKGPINLFLPKE